MGEVRSEAEDFVGSERGSMFSSGVRVLERGLLENAERFPLSLWVDDSVLNGPSGHPIVKINISPSMLFRQYTFRTTLPLKLFFGGHHKAAQNLATLG